jgi:hypothetical protein
VERFERRAVPNVARRAKGTPTSILDFLRDRLDAFHAPSGRNDVRSRIRESQAERPADAIGATEDDGDAAIETQGLGHGSAFATPMS